MEPMTFEQLSSFLLSQMTKFILYGDEPKLEYIQEQLNQYHIPVEEWKKLLIPQAKLLGFKFWKEDSNLMLIPGYLYQYIPEGLELYSISGEKEQYESYADLDNDCRFGCLAYGIYMQEQA